MLKKLTIVLGMAVAVAGTTTVSSFVFVPEAHAGWYKKAKKAAKKVGRKANNGAKYIGRKAKSGAKKGTRVVRRSGIRNSFSAGEIARAGKWVGRTARKGGRAVGRTTWKGGKSVGRNGRAFGRSAWKRGKSAGRVAKDVGKGFGGMGKCIVKRNCKGTIGDLPAGTKGNPRPAVRYRRG